MKKLMWLLAIATFLSTTVLAQSSGSFNFQSDTTACTDTSGLLGSGSTQTALTTTMKVSSGNGVALVIRPSAVVGLLTNLSLTKTGLASSQAGVNFQVTVKPLGGQAAPTVMPATPVTYDDRYVSISTNLFDAISTQCLAISGGCYFNFNETTLSAHSFDWVVTNLSSGNYEITVTWTPYSTATAPNSAQTCVGPIILTAEQTKIFNQNTGISF
jgi:hypothetical protein